VNVVCPGMTDTPLMQAIRAQSEKTEKIIDAVIKATPFRRAAKPEEIASMVVFLASGDSDFMTGQTISVSGGLTMV
jgi:2-hydroxycyclohexanecarboxyl-CoA dehydrogenase